MKVALIGNMNNNHFAMMRYFHRLGVEAYLFKFSNEFDHFQPECDTYEFEKWESYIIQTDIIDGDIKQYLRLKKTYLFNLFKGFDFYVGNGMSSAYLLKAGISLDIFIPYCVGIEYTYRVEKKNVFDYFKEKIVALIQENAIKKNVKIVCAADDTTFKKSNSLGKKTLPYTIPMVYNLEDLSNVNTNVSVDKIVEKIKSYDFTVFSHVSHVSHKSEIYKIKRNDILINSFAEYIKQNPEHNSVLILLEYGSDLKYSKDLIIELAIESYVIWLPLMMRKELLLVLEHVSIGCGELGGYFWGGTGWEFLSMGKLFIWSVGMDKNKLSEMINTPLPNFVNSNDVKEISNFFNYYYHNKVELEKLGIENKIWFNKYGGIELARKYIDLFNNLEY